MAGKTAARKQKPVKVRQPNEAATGQRKLPAKADLGIGDHQHRPAKAPASPAERGTAKGSTAASTQPRNAAPKRRNGQSARKGSKS